VRWSERRAVADADCLLAADFFPVDLHAPAESRWPES
jgi:hypothetical protein